MKNVREVIYMQNAHQAQDNEKQWQALHPPRFPHDKKGILFPKGREGKSLSLPWQWHEMVLNNIRTLAMPTQLQAPYPHGYCKKLTLSLTQTRTHFQLRGCLVPLQSEVELLSLSYKDSSRNHAIISCSGEDKSFFALGSTWTLSIWVREKT